MKQHTRSSLLRRLRSLGSRRNIAGMARFGIKSTKAFGVGAKPLHALARSVGTNHRLAAELWKTGYLEARMLASLIDDPELVTPRQMDRWVGDFDNWALCDTCCGVLFDKTPFAVRKAIQWSRHPREFVRRAGFVLMAELAVHDKQAPDSLFLRFFPAIRRGAADERNGVKKAVNWAVRQIGKRNASLHPHAVRLARELHALGTPSARWIASDALRELTHPKVKARLKKKR